MYEEGNRQMKLLKFLMVFLLSLMLVGCEADDGLLNNGLLGSLTTNSSSSIDLNSIPKYNGEEFVTIKIKRQHLLKHIAHLIILEDVVRHMQI